MASITYRALWRWHFHAGMFCIPFVLVLALTGSIYLFKPLKEQVLVYSDPFKLTMDIQVGTVPPKAAPLKITGTLSYQACDDRVCYLPESVPLQWTIPVKR